MNMSFGCFLLFLLTIGCEKKTFVDTSLGEAVGGYHETTFHDDRFVADKWAAIFPSISEFTRAQLAKNQPEDFVSCLSKPRAFSYLREIHENFGGQRPINEKTKATVVIKKVDKSTFDTFIKEDTSPTALRRRTEIFKDENGIQFEIRETDQAERASSHCELTPTSAVQQTIEPGSFVMESGEQVIANRIIKKYTGTFSCGEQKQTAHLTEVNIVTTQYPSIQLPCAFESTIYSHHTARLEGGQKVREFHLEILNSR